MSEPSNKNFEHNPRHSQAFSTLDKPTGTSEKTPLKPETPKKKWSLKNTLLVGGAGIALVATAAGVGISASNSGEKPPTETETSAPGPETQIDILAQNIAERPAVGTPEYETLMKEEFSIPYVAGQAPEEVLTRAANVIINLPDATYRDAPQNIDDVTKLMIETGVSVEDIAATELQPDYYLNGFADEVFGDNWKNDSFLSQIVPHFKVIQNERTEMYLQDAAEPGHDVVIGDVVLISANDTDIYALHTNKFEDTGADAGEANIHLQAVDTDGDSQLDSWHVVGSGDGR